MKSNENNKSLYDARISELQRRKDYTDKEYDRNGGMMKTESRHIIHTDTQFDSLQNFLNAIQTGDDNTLSHNDTPRRMIVSLLTTTPDLVYEISQGSLFYHQRRIVEALTKLQENNPDKFNSFYAKLEEDFANLQRSTSWRYSERYFKLLGEYYLRSGKFNPQYIEAKHLIDVVSRRLTYKFIYDEFNDYKIEYDDYKDNPEKLIELLVKKHGVETGLTREDLEKIARGENLLDRDEKNLPQEALKEIEDFEKKIRFLVVIGRQIKMPTLEEFKQAYLR